ncbi:sigma-w pathway protein ysdB [Salicibibacter kimchii]|uniref:Sigma-w pathway protein ysdB n=2 Tax=Salicibibacter kimchii TaxID=2099786 RepID=A0A345BY21_9BACI|nr:sigma-w pathway protein ysdB [Salicibibacter kimchii]AXF55852.1 sigma-w pathway protein ysdB [Salicibibacter kimchii]
MTLLLQLFVLAALIILVYTIIRYLRSPLRKLEQAQNDNQYFLYDDRQNARKNFYLTYKGAMFEGEKKVGSTDHSFEIVRISVRPKRTDMLEGLQYDDFMFIEKEIKERYPHASVEWKSPVAELMKKRK